MRHQKFWGCALAGMAAGAVGGIFGAGGGMVLVPLLGLLTDLKDQEIFSASLAIILPICLVTIWTTSMSGPLPWRESVPWLIGSTIGGILAGQFGKHIPVKWLHRGLGILILWGGIRYLWS